MSSARDVLGAAVEAWNASDEVKVLALVDPEAELVSPGGLNFHGIGGFKRWYRLWAEACPDRVIRYHNVVDSGSQLIGEGTFTGTHTGTLRLPSGDIAPTGRRLSADFVAVLRESNGKLSYLRHYFDVLDLMVQLGVAGAPARV